MPSSSMAARAYSPLSTTLAIRKERGLDERVYRWTAGQPGAGDDEE
jgi:hypothetical protein